ncbi:MAG: NADP-dependent malic enzyme [Acholeplasmataceae bacterium]|nr:NADP-dependent malic enzyme [Acholeplasmataceae bacterium]
MDYKKESIKLHQKLKGKIEMISRVKIKSTYDLVTAYSPGVAQPCLEIQKHPELSYHYTRRHNMVAVITDGSAVLGLGNIGPEASMPVMEGKCVLFKTFGSVDAIPICLRTQDVDEIVRTIALLAGSFGGINLEDISAPRCFEIEERLKAICDIPVFHDDQHGTAVVVGAALHNALKLAQKHIASIKIVINGIGAAGTAIAKYLLCLGVKNLVLCDRFGILHEDDDGLSSVHKALASQTNRTKMKGYLADALVHADVFIGVSGPNCVTKAMIQSMNEKPIVFAMANPDPEIPRNDALEAGAFIVGTGSSNDPNQINNVLAFPGIFRGALDAKASDITYAMMHAASKAIAEAIPAHLISTDYIIPSPLDPLVHQEVAKAVKETALRTQVRKTH